MKRMSLLVILIMVASTVVACAESEPEVVEKEVTRVVKETVVETVVEKETVVETIVEQETVLQTIVEKETVVQTVVEEIVITATPETSVESEVPRVGGTMVIALNQEPDTLDPAHTASEKGIMENLGASLVIRDPTTGEYVPYLAKSWQMSKDGLTWDFILREDVKFHDGTPLTAHDYAWTLNRAIDPETKSIGTGVFISTLASAEAVDDYTLRLHLQTPSFPTLFYLTWRGWLQPLPKAAVEEMGDEFGRQPIGVGPYRFKEWQTAEKVVLERNPDYSWRPDFIDGGPYIETLEFRIIPEYATIAAGLEAGEIDLYNDVEPKDVQRLKDTGRFQIYEWPQQGLFSMVLQGGRPPFDDLNVRKAFNLAVDRQSLIKVAALGYAVEQRGPMSPSVAGYWPGVEEIGYGYDLTQAKNLMKEAGYTMGADGVLVKDGQPLKLEMLTVSENVKDAQILKEQYEALGADLTITVLESIVDPLFSGDFQILLDAFTGWQEADILVLFFGSGEIGGYSVPGIDDPELDRLLAATRTTLDPNKRQEALNAAVTRIVEQALVVPLYAPTRFNAVSTRIKDEVVSPITGDLWLIPAYIGTE